MRNFTLHKFLATLLMAVCSATLSVAQNVAKIGTTEYATLKEAVDAVQTGTKGYIYILNDASFDDLRIEGKQIIINLQNHTVTGNKIDVYGTEGTDTYLKILDSKAKGLSVDKNNNYSVSYTTSGTLQLTRSITAYEGACIKVESGTVVSTTSFALLAYGDVTGQSDVASSIEVTGGYVKAQEGCVSPRGRGASVTVGPTKYSERKSMPVLESLDNAAVMGNGTYKANEKLGGTSITISGNCWLIGRIQTSGYAACGIYHPQQGSLSIKYYYGAPNIVAVNGAGIVMRGGTLDYRAGNITATGDASFVGKVGDADAQIGNCGIVYDYDCGYYDTANAKIKITNGYKNTNVVGSKSAIQVFNSKAQDAKQNIADVFDIQGGVFSSDVSAYVNTDDGRETFGHEGTYYVGKFVAQVEGGLKYESFLTAINNAPAGSTVVLLKDRTEQSSEPQIKKDVTIDLNGKNLTLSSMTVNKGGNLTIKDSGTGGTYNGLGANYSIYVREGGIFNLESGTLTNSSTNPKTQNVVVRVVGDATTPVASTANIMGGKIETKGTPVSVFEPGATVNVSGGELKGSGLACIAGNGTKGQGGTTINVSGGTLTAKPYDATSAACGIYHPNEGTLNITGGTINVADGVGVLMRGGEMTMTGGEINATGDDATRTGSVGDTNQKIGVSGVIFDRDANYPAVATTSIKIDGDAKVSGAKAAVELINDNNVADAKSAFKLKGGTYSSDVSALLDENSVAEEKNGVYVVTTYYAQVGETKYATLQKAADAATAGQTVTVLNDVDMTTDGNLTVNEGKDIVLDMNGHSIKGANADHKNIMVYGKLTLKDSKENSTGKIYSEDPYKKGVYDKTLIYVDGNGEFVMESGHINTVLPNSVDNGQFAIGAFENCKVTINGGTIEGGYSAITGFGDPNDNTTITINGGTLICPMDYAIYHPQPGKLTVNEGATIYGGAGAICMKSGELEINGGTLTSKGKGNTGNWGDGTGGLGNAALNFCKPYGNVKATIKGGTITAEGDAVLIDAQPTEGKTVTLAIEGGTYSSDVSKYCSPGFTATPNADGTYGITHVGDGVLVVYDKSYEQVNAGGAVDIDMDLVNKILVAEAGVNGVNTTLTKNYTNTGWNAFFVPFDLTLTDEMLNDFEFATLYAIALENGNGSPVISYKKMKAGDKIAAFFPCLIKAKATGEQKLYFGKVDYKSIKGVAPQYSCSTTEQYTFHPVMENTCLVAKKGYYLNSKQNSFVYNTHPEAYLPPFLYYMTIQDKATMSYIVPDNGGASKAKICVIGENEPTGITDLVDEAASASGKIYNLQGVVVGNTTEGLPKGVYIKNGRKIIVK